MDGRSESEKRTEELLAHFDRAQRLAKAGSWEWNIVTNGLIWSPQIYRIFGLVPDAFEPNYPAFLESVHPDDRHIVEHGVARAIEGTEIYDVDHRIVLPDGSVRIVHERGDVEFDASGRPIRMLGAVEDVTDARAHAETARRYQDMLSSMLQISAEAIIICGADGRIELFNQGAQSVFGYVPDEIVGLDIQTLIPTRLRESYIQEFGLFIEGTPDSIRMQSETEMFGLRKNGEEFPIEVSVAKMATGEGFSLTLIARDLTPWKTSERLLIEARVEAERANLAKSTFLANMTHEIRTPLNGVLGIAAALARTELSAKQVRMVELIETSGRALNSLLGDILDMAKVDAGRMVVRAEPFDLSRLVRDTLGLFRASAAEKGVEFNFMLAADARGRFIGDELKIGQVLSNLLSNAVKFTDQGIVRVSAEVSPGSGESDCRIRIAVEDSGIGFTPEAGAVIFQRFEQADGSNTRQFGGSGLGLAISKALVELMGGSIEASSSPGVGSIFAFEIPLTRAASQPAADPVPLRDELTPHSERLNILLAEDREINRMTVEMILDGLPVTLTCVENGLEAVAATENRAFDLILMDLQMPVMDGFTAIRHIRAREANSGSRRVPICVLTGNAQTEARENATRCGAETFLTKPLDVSALLNLIEETSAALGAPSSQHP